MKYLKKTEITKNIKSHDIGVPLYLRTVEIIFYPQSIKLEKDWHTDSAKTASAQTRNYIDEHGKITISIYEKQPGISTVVHELTHATQMILYHAGHKHDDKDADEPFAYLLGYLVREFIKLCKKNKIKIKLS